MVAGASYEVITLGGKLRDTTDTIRYPLRNTSVIRSKDEAKNLSGRWCDRFKLGFRVIECLNVA